MVRQFCLGFQRGTRCVRKQNEYLHTDYFCARKSYLEHLTLTHMSVDKGVAFLVMDKDIPYFFCSSEYPTRKTMERYGIQNMTW